MAKRKLHGETQKRRKKKLTQALKRQDSIARVQTTQRPAEFERSGVVERGDLEFLGAMQEMGVQRMPKAGEAPVRMEKFERAIFEEGQAEGGQFEEAMIGLGVKPMGGGTSSRPTVGGRVDAPNQKSDPGNPRIERPAQAAEKTPDRPESEGPGPEMFNATTQKDGALKDGAQKAEPPKAERPAPRPSNPGRNPAPFTQFDLEEDPAALEELLAREGQDGTFDPAQKYEGAPPRPARARSASPQPAPEAPDGELDLHGKTQEEAIRMVTNFLLTSSQQRLRHVLIITGRGNRSGPGGPVLRGAVESWLARNGSKYARTFRPAPQEHGGDGAIWVEML